MSVDFCCKIDEHPVAPYMFCGVFWDAQPL